MAVDNLGASGISVRKVGGPRPGSGRPAFKPTDEQRALVEQLAGYGLPEHQIAALVAIDCDADTLRKHFRQELAQGRAKANTEIARTLYQKAMAGDTASLIWWTKAQMRWTSLQQIQVQSEQRISIVSALEQAEGRIIEGEAVEPGQMGMSGSIGMSEPAPAHDPVARLVPEAAPEGLDAPQGLTIPQFAPRGGEGN